MPISVEIIVTIPELVLESSFIRNEIFQALKYKTGPAMQKMFNGTTNGWSRPPKFYQGGHNWTSEVSVKVYTVSEIYGYVNSGTPAHRISARRYGTLRFQPGYRAATRPGSMMSSKPSRFGNYITPLSVNHPGIEAREFDVQVAEAIYPDFVSDVEEAIRIGVKVQPG